LNDILPLTTFLFFTVVLK